MTAHVNGASPSAEGPVVGSMLIWRPKGYYKGTGHVAIVVTVTVRPGHGSRAGWGRMGIDLTAAFK